MRASGPSVATRRFTCPACRGELGGVGQKIGHHLIEAVRIADDQRGRHRLIQVDAGGLEAGGERIGGLARHPTDIEKTSFEMESGRLRGGQSLQILDHAAQSNRFIVHRDQRRRRRLGHLVHQTLRSPPAAPRSGCEVRGRHPRREPDEADPPVRATPAMAVERPGPGRRAPRARLDRRPGPCWPLLPGPWRPRQPADGADQTPGDHTATRGPPGSPAPHSSRRRSVSSNASGDRSLESPPAGKASRRCRSDSIRR